MYLPLYNTQPGRTLVPHEPNLLRVHLSNHLLTYHLHTTLGSTLGFNSQQDHPSIQSLGSVGVSIRRSHFYIGSTSRFWSASSPTENPSIHTTYDTSSLRQLSITPPSTSKWLHPLPKSCSDKSTTPTHRATPTSTPPYQPPGLVVASLDVPRASSGG